MALLFAEDSLLNRRMKMRPSPVLISGEERAHFHEPLRLIEPL